MSEREAEAQAEENEEEDKWAPLVGETSKGKFCSNLFMLSAVRSKGKHTRRQEEREKRRTSRENELHTHSLTLWKREKAMDGTSRRSRTRRGHHKELHIIVQLTTGTTPTDGQRHSKNGTRDNVMTHDSLCSLSSHRNPSLLCSSDQIDSRSSRSAGTVHHSLSFPFPSSSSFFSHTRHLLTQFASFFPLHDVFFSCDVVVLYSHL